MGNTIKKAEIAVIEGVTVLHIPTPYGQLDVSVDPGAKEADVTILHKGSSAVAVSMQGDGTAQIFRDGGDKPGALSKEFTGIYKNLMAIAKRGSILESDIAALTVQFKPLQNSNHPGKLVEPSHETLEQIVMGEKPIVPFQRGRVSLTATAEGLAKGAVTLRLKGDDEKFGTADDLVLKTSSGAITTADGKQTLATLDKKTLDTVLKHSKQIVGEKNQVVRDVILGQLGDLVNEVARDATPKRPDGLRSVY